VIIPHFLEDDVNAYKLINTLPKEKLIIVDKKIPGISGQFSVVYENFEKNIYESLREAKESLAKYNRINLIFPAHSYYPIEIVDGFKSFCQDFAFDYAILDSPKNIHLLHGDVFIIVNEDDLIVLMDQIFEKKLQIGIDVGLISYNETPIKRLIGQGISTISTDFKQLGITAAELVMSGDKVQIENPFYFTHRPSI
jgi:DNA-binding LacI/PurR family transcriptional regulator